MHATVRQDLILGLTLTAFFCMVYFVLIPLGIEVPRSHDPGQLSPAAYPSWIALAGLGASLLLTANNATVTLCHSKTRDLKAKCAAADIIVAAIGKAGFVTADMVKEGAVVIDVGINRNAEGKLCGDVDFAPVAEKAAYITPVPGGVGLMTRAMLMKNTVKAARLQSGL